MDKTEDSGTPRWAASLDVAKAFFTAASTAAIQSQRPSVVFSSSDDNTGSQLQKLQRQVTRVLKGFSSPPEVKGAYNPEVLTSQKRQWSRFQLQSLEQKPVKEPSEIFESMVIVGLHPNSNVQELEKFVLERSNDEPKRMRSFLNSQHQVHSVPDIEPEVLFVYPPAKQLPIKHRDLFSFCFPGGLEVHSIERTPSLSELNEILLGQEQLKQSNHSFVFRLQVADDSTLYGCCVLVEEIIQKPSKLVSLSVAEKPSVSKLSRYIMTTSRCYCILSRLPFFDLHFGIIRSIFIQERFELLTKGIDMLNLLSQEDVHEEEISNHITSSALLEPICIEDATNLTGAFSENLKATSKSDLDNESYVDIQLHEEQNFVNEHLSELQDEVSENGAQSETNKVGEDVGTSSQPGHDDSGNGIILITASGSYFSDQNFVDKQLHDLQDVVSQNNSQFETNQLREYSGASIQHGHDYSANGIAGKKASESHVSDSVLSLLRSGVYGSSKSSSFEVSPCGDESFRSDVDGGDSEEPSSSGRRDSDHNGSILQWAKENGHGSLQIVCKYYELHCPARGSRVIFQPLEHLHQIEFCRPAETVLHIAGSSFDLRSHGSSLEVAEAHNALLAEEEATALSVWTVAALCGCLRLEHMMTMFAGALLEKHIVVVCSNLGMLSASVLSIIPLIRPYRWQSLLMPVLPNDMLEFLDAPVPYIVGIKNKPADIQSKLANVILVDANKNQVKSPSMPPLPQQKELFSSLAPYHAKLVGESYLARKRPVHECTDVQIEAAKGFLAVIRCYLDSFCSNLRSHTITNVQSNNDKVSLLLKESFIDSFPHRDQPFMKLFVDTQLFSVHTDVVLSLYQKD